MKKFGERLVALTVASILLIMMAAPMINASPVPYPQPAYFGCPSSSGLPSHVLVFMTLSNPTGLSKFLDTAYYSQTSHSYHKFITATQFAALYGTPATVVNKVKNALTSNGLTIILTAPMLVEASGTDTQVDAGILQLAQTSSIQSYMIGAECFPETSGDQPAPGTLAPHYSPDYIQGPSLSALPISATTNLADSGACIYNEPNGGGLVWFPCGLQTIYDENPLLNGGVSGSGQTIALVDGFGDVNTAEANVGTYDNIACSDFGIFNTDFGLPNPTCTVVYPTGEPVLTTSANIQAAEGWSTETSIDLQYAHVMAPHAHILEVSSSTDYDDLFGSIEYVVNNHMANMISLSWGNWEDLVYSPPNGGALMVGYDEIFQQAAAQGIGVFAASGDYGAYDPVTGEIAPLTPATDSWVSAVGGSTLWGTFTATSVSRIETAWSFGSDYWNPYIGTGGGYSWLLPETHGQHLISIPYQLSSISEPVLGITVYPPGQRGLPDVSALADPYTGVPIIQDGSFSPYVWGGTSLAAPMTAGMTATIQSKGSFIVGDLAPSLYLLYRHGVQTFYVWKTKLGLSALSTGIPGVMFYTASGENGPFNVTPYVWNPVTGLGQINVWGLSQVISSAG